MKVKIAYDFDEKEYIAFVDQLPVIAGYGPSEKDAILHLLKQAQQEKGFNHVVIKILIDKIENAN